MARPGRPGALLRSLGKVDWLSSPGPNEARHCSPPKSLGGGQSPHAAARAEGCGWGSILRAAASSRRLRAEHARGRVPPVASVAAKRHQVRYRARRLGSRLHVVAIGPRLEMVMELVVVQLGGCLEGVMMHSMRVVLVSPARRPESSSWVHVLHLEALHAHQVVMVDVGRICRSVVGDWVCFVSARTEARQGRQHGGG